ncbi:DUF1697 domain-containing protein [Amphritea pacifica]|uniref:DUF1697 domain-containing protein n=1 Tax=Amphritea pacifica TaxID=2811233 RepID=A0ABS2WCK8_9GAMM|nr:DUF1697 domain-containing protein [Amphritea pacifica]MBN0989446.1 DUF1697 domain-containing protein [Amphritea pacifica]MBN1006946.1 DUF1697 domain-containing protein [Amphritea pacifica]
MKTYILLFRGINVGGRNILPMADLRLLLQQNGFDAVQTYIQSGNVILKGKTKPGESVIREIEAGFGFRPEMIVLGEDEFDAAVEHNPYDLADGKSVHFYFLQHEPQPDRAKLMALASETERFEIKGKVFYLQAPDGIGRSKLVAGLEKCLGVPATGRNLNTINKLRQMAETV